MSQLFDSGAFIALERNDRAMWERLAVAHRSGTSPLTHAGVLGQVWRGGRRQARLSQALRAVEVFSLDEKLARGAGFLLAATGQGDVVDAALVAMALDGDEIVTADAKHLAPLARAHGRDILLISMHA